MKIAVIGAGILGISMAHELVKDGHEVTVFESKASVAEGSSFANAGVMSLALTHPDISSWLFNSTFRSVLGSSYGLHVHKSFSLKQWAWLIKRSGGHVADPLSADHLKWKSLLELARLSAEQFDLTSSDLQLSFDGQKGQLILLRTESDQRSLTSAMSNLQSEGLSFKLLNADDTYRLEPALQTDTPLVGAVHLPEDQIANCRQLAQLLKQQCEKLQAKFVFQVGVNALKTIPEGVELQLSNGTSASFQAAVVCSGVKAADLLKPWGMACPMESVYGYSISSPMKEPLNAPQSAIWDLKHQVHISRLGQRVRVSGSYELDGDPDDQDTSSLKILYKTLQDWFPGAAQLDQSTQVWKGARPTLADGLPVVGASGIKGVWLNFGHGNLGWTLAMGSANVIARQISERHVALNMEHFGIHRF